jgi:hypothetical protein
LDIKSAGQSKALEVHRLTESQREWFTLTNVA